MSLSTKPYKGTRDFYPEDMRIQNWMFAQLRQTVQKYGFEEYNGPMLESFDLYAAKTGEEIVNTQLYHFEDRAKRKVAIRPEMTPTLARMVAGRLRELAKPVKWFSLPNLWRYENPQRGRLREHWQLNVDLLGGDPILADFEILSVARDLIGSFNGGDKIKIHINSRRLINHFFNDRLCISAEMALAASKAVDARAKIGQDAYNEWLEKIGLNKDQISLMEEFFQSDFRQIQKNFDNPGVQELADLFAMIDSSELSEVAIFDPFIMRGMDYYTGTVFEMYDISPENNRAMFGGGRYDNLVGLFGNQQLSGVGFGMGDVTLRNFLETHNLLPQLPGAVEVFMTLPKKSVYPTAHAIEKQLRDHGLRVFNPLSEGKFANQLKLANKLNAKFAILLGDEEINSGQFAIKNLQSGEQKNFPLNDVKACLNFLQMG